MSRVRLRSGMKMSSAKKLRRALTDVMIPRLASKERTRTWGTNDWKIIFERDTEDTKIKRSSGVLVLGACVSIVNCTSLGRA